MRRAFLPKNSPSKGTSSKPAVQELDDYDYDLHTEAFEYGSI